MSLVGVTSVQRPRHGRKPPLTSRRYYVKVLYNIASWLPRYTQRHSSKRVAFAAFRYCPRWWPPQSRTISRNISVSLAHCTGGQSAGEQRTLWCYAKWYVMGSTDSETYWNERDRVAASMTKPKFFYQLENSNLLSVGQALLTWGKSDWCAVVGWASLTAEEDESEFSYP